MISKEIEKKFEMFELNPNDKLSVKLLQGYGCSQRDIVEFQNKWNLKKRGK